jgi:hypothetical protein
MRNLNPMKRNQLLYAKLDLGFLKIFLAILALIMVWSTMLPLFAGPDEHSNFIKSAAVIRGELVGQNVPASPEMFYWTTSVDIDPRFSTALAGPACFIFMSEKPACDVPVGSIAIVSDPPWTQMGRYPPAVFLVSGVGTLFGPRDLSAFASRYVIGALCALFLAVSVHGLRRRARTVVGVLIAITPGVIFVSAVNNTSGVEICSAVLLWTLLPDLLAGEKMSRLEQIVIGAAGVFLIGARPLGFVSYGIVLVLIVCATWSRKINLRSLLQRRWLLSAQIIAIVFSIWWFVWIYGFQTSPSYVRNIPGLPRGELLIEILSHLPDVIKQSYGNFGWLDTPTPTSALYLKLAMAIVVVGLQWRKVSQRTRFIALATVVSAIAFGVLVDFQMYSFVRGFGLQGRHIVPLLVGVPIVLFARDDWRAKREYWVASVWAILMIWCGAAALRRYSVGIKPGNQFELLTNPVWAPKIGILYSLVLLVIAASAVALVCVQPKQKM